MGGCPHHVIILVPQSSYLKSDLQHGLVGMVTLWYTCIHIHSDTTTDNASYKIRSRLKLPSNMLMTAPPRKHNHQDKAQSCTFWLRVPLYNIPHPSESKVKESNVPFPMWQFQNHFQNMQWCAMWGAWYHRRNRTQWSGNRQQRATGSAVDKIATKMKHPNWQSIEADLEIAPALELIGKGFKTAIKNMLENLNSLR